ncbi:Phosphatidylinositol N-acetylglucosaminyltransferase subunit A [Astathelohania contejeani]|uniref:Phosphatidylinositol N-acetylglucosaminyltransferase subunit A n=1 Tax=Astathelohania contejeani TaxID=164912 RepID=A0ABQ7HVS7_9MICR|nr:Phosphatidylinositol N-acetylglucosaminyltransferase subunit A [Thelohania contejeani]
MNIAMVTDFFYPNIGGIETHIQAMAKYLQKKGHRVIVITHIYDDIEGVHYINGIKTYYIHIPIIAQNTSFPSVLGSTFELRRIFLNEKIDLVHGHQSMSNLAMEGIFHAQTLGLRTVFTEHSLFECGTVENLVVNMLARWVLLDVDRVICVSYTTKENLMYRTHLPSKLIHVIPNAVEKNKFACNKKKTNGNITIIVASRLVYRKGIDILVEALPRICMLDKRIKMIIGGDGPKRDEIEQVIDEYNLSNRVITIGEVPHNEMPEFLSQGDIFLNTSLTESFGISIIEAALCGLMVVSTNVGGVHEVLPDELITLTLPTADGIINGIKYAINKINGNKLETNKQISEIYTWDYVTELTENVYLSIEKRKKKRMIERLNKYKGVGGFLFSILILFDQVVYSICDYFKFIGA